MFFLQSLETINTKQRNKTMTFDIIRDEDSTVIFYMIDGFQVSKEVYWIVINHIAEKEKERC